MSLKQDIKKNDKLVIHSEKTGFIHGWALQDKEGLGDAYLEVAINSASLPGVSKLTINVNTFDVWKADNVEALQRIAGYFLRPEYTR